MIKMHLIDLAQSTDSQLSLPEGEIASLRTTVETLQETLQKTRQRASQSNREHLLLMHQHNQAEGEICRLREELDQSRRQFAALEKRIPRLLRGFLGI